MIDRGLKIMSLQYQDKILTIVPTRAATIQDFHPSAKNVIKHDLLRGDVTTNIYFANDNYSYQK